MDIPNNRVGAHKWTSPQLAIFIAAFLSVFISASLALMSCLCADRKETPKTGYAWLQHLSLACKLPSFFCTCTSCPNVLHTIVDSWLIYFQANHTMLSNNDYFSEPLLRIVSGVKFDMHIVAWWQLREDLALQTVSCETWELCPLKETP